MQSLPYEDVFESHKNEPVGRTHFHMNGFFLTQRHKEMALSFEDRAPKHVAQAVRSFMILLKLLRVLNCKFTNYAYGFPPLSLHSNWHTLFYR